MPVYNAAAFLKESIASVQAQRLTDWELIAVDDGSTDNSASILTNLAHTDARIRLVSTGGNLGAGGARNHGMDAAQGRFIAFLDADDLWHSDKLSRQLRAMETTGTPFSCTSYLRHNLDTDKKTAIGVPARATWADLLKTNTVACSTAMIDTAYFGQRHMSNLQRRQDFLFWLQLLQATPFVLGLPEVLMTYRQHGRSLSAPKTRAAANTWTMYRQSLGMPMPSAAWYFSNYALRGLLRHRAPKLAQAIGWLHAAEHPQ